VDDEKVRYVGNTHLSRRFNGYDKNLRDEYLKAYRENRTAKLVELQDVLKGLIKNEEYYFNRFYSQSWNLYSVQKHVVTSVDLLQSLIPNLAFNPYYMQILSEGTGREFTHAVNGRWTAELRPVIEAMVHTKYMVKLVLNTDESESDNNLVYELGPLFSLYG
jgi:hypothetical protein